MPTYVVLTRLTPEAVKTPGELRRLEQAVADHIRKDCPHGQTETWTAIPWERFKLMLPA